MVRTRIEDLPMDIEITRNEMAMILGGVMETYEEEIELYGGTIPPLRFVRATGDCGIETVPLPE